ncbi:MAG: DUF29 domain-containing protein [Methylobacteriaceae bacterium]|nr:DUF29 domain-containing protein [Methylobacteriaceae bacterium]
MSVPARTIADEAGRALSLYDQDFHAWTAEQARLLRAAQLDRLDVQHLAEEIDDLGKSVRRELRNRTRTLVEHLLKLQCSRAGEPERGWLETVRRTRIEIRDLLDESPSLKRELGDLLGQVQHSAGELAAQSLASANEDTGTIHSRLLAGGYSVDEVFGDWLPERL